MGSTWGNSLGTAPIGEVGTALPSHSAAGIVMTRAWQNSVLPRRGGPDVPIKPADEQAIAAIRDVIFESRHKDIHAMLSYHRTRPDAAAAARRFVGERRFMRGQSPGVADACGAGVVAFLNLVPKVKPADYADFWIADYGLPFAMQAAMQFAAFDSVFNGWASSDFPVADLWRHGRVDRLGIAVRLRERATQATADDYSAAMRSIVDLRRTPRQLCLAAFVFPTNDAWVGDACRTPTGLVEERSRLELLTSVSAVDMVSDLLFVNTRWDSYYQDYRRILPTLVDRFGAALVPVLDRILQNHLSKDRAGHVAEALACLPGDEAFAVLLKHGDREGVRPAVIRAVANFPERSHRILAGLDTTLAHELLAATRLREPATVEQESPERLPALLADPPWRHQRPAAAAPSPKRALRLPKPELVWLPEELAQARSTTTLKRTNRSWSDIETCCREGGSSHDFIEILLAGPEHLVDRLIRSSWVPRWSYGGSSRFPAAVLRVGPPVGPLAVRLAEKDNDGDIRRYVGPILSSEVAIGVAEWLCGPRRPLIAAARAYLGRHRARVVPYLLATGSGPQREAAHHALRYVADNDSRDAVIEAAREHDPEAVPLVTAILDFDPIYLLPKRIPKMPDWARSALSTPIRLLDGGVLPPEAVQPIVVMLMMSGPIRPYAGLLKLAQCCDVSSLNRLSWALFDAWWSFGAPAAHRWALDTLAWFADDESVDELADMISRWPSAGRSGRVPHGLEVLSTIGTDHALLRLFRLSKKARSKPLRDKAADRLTEIAVTRGLSDEELADRLVPDLGLDESSALEFDYGSRRFILEFDELLRPQVRDGTGALLRSFPKPGKRDDPEMSAASYKRFTRLKREVRVISQEQVRRLEAAMIYERRWKIPEFDMIFVRHPLLVHLARRLVWAQFDHSGRLRSTFRIAEDHSYADQADDAICLDPHFTVGLAHPLQVDLAPWSALFADYDILQPFNQIGRFVIAATAADLAGAVLTRFDAVNASSLALLGLGGRGWTLGEPLDGPSRIQFTRPAPNGRTVSIWLSPGIPAYDPREVETQRVKVEVDDGTLGDLGLIFVSEVVTDVTGTLDR